MNKCYNCKEPGLASDEDRSIPICGRCRETRGST
jgi:hypothetical protein